MSAKPVIVLPEDRQPALRVLGTRITVLAADAEIEDQAFTVQSGDEGTGPPPHRHDWDESFYVTRGQVHFWCDDLQAICVAGSFVHVPAGTVHAFSYGPGGGEMLEVTGRHSQAIAMFTRLDREAPSDVPTVVRVLGDCGVKVEV